MGLLFRSQVFITDVSRKDSKLDVLFLVVKKNKG
jgi:hypothetical protein